MLVYTWTLKACTFAPFVLIRRQLTMSRSPQSILVYYFYLHLDFEN